jgi:hypothetical protein
MKTAKDQRYSRVGDWRIIFRVNEAKGTLDINDCGVFRDRELQIEKVGIPGGHPWNNFRRDTG